MKCGICKRELGVDADPLSGDCGGDCVSCMVDAGDLEPGVHAALTIAKRYGGVDGDHHKAWVIDQMARCLTGSAYPRFIAEARAGDDGAQTFAWSEGIPP